MAISVSRILEKPVVRYCGAIGIVLIALALRLLMVPLVGATTKPYITFYPSVMVVAVMAGFWPGVLATVLSAVLADYFILSRTRTLSVPSLADAVTMALFVGMGLLISIIAERYRRNQRMLAHSAEAQLKLFVEYAPAALAMFDREMRYVCASRRWALGAGLEDRDLTGLSHYDVFPGIAEYWKESHRRALAGEVLKFDADRFVQEDGQVRWIRREIRPWIDSAGNVGGILIFAEDITERKRIEDQLQRLTRTYAVLSDINQMIVREPDQSAMLAAACRIAVEKGNFRLAWIGMIDPVTLNATSIMSSGDTQGYLDSTPVITSEEQRLNSPVARCIRSGKHAVCNDLEHDPVGHPWREKGLQCGYLSSAAFPLTLHGKLIAVFVLYAGEPNFFDAEELALLDEMAIDISFAMELSQRELERQKVEEELRWRTAFFEAQMESSVDGIMVRDVKGELIFRNRRFVELWQLPESLDSTGDGKKQIDFALTRVKNPQQLIKDIDDIRAHPDDVSQGEVELKDGTTLVRITSPVKDASGKSYGRLWVFQDVTHQRQLERQLRQAQKMEAVGQLTGGIAHDFNNLLGIILGNLDLLEQMLPDNEAALRRVRTAQAASLRGANVTRHLLSFCRSGELKPESTVLHRSVANVINLARTLGPDIKFMVQLDESLPLVLVDSSGLENALLNLIVNARDAMPKGGSITIATQLKKLDDAHPVVHSGEMTAGTHACITLSDTGSGMSNDTLERAFEPFFTTKDVGKGTGLGLSMVYGFVKQSGGAVRIYSELDHGTTITIYLPLSDPDAHQDLIATPALASEKLTGRVLVVDDEPHLIELARVYLEAIGFVVYSAKDPEEALQIAARETELDLMITDIIMPGNINGVELAHRIREKLPRIKVIYSSGYPADAMADRGLPRIDGHLLRKPYARTEFEATVRGAMV